MGAADIVPGVSGGTMAFILGIYEELIDSIRTLGTKEFFTVVLHGRLREAVAMVNWRFLLALLSGIATAILSLARTLEYLLIHEPILIWSFFFGLVLASVVVVSQRIKRWTRPLLLSAIIGGVGAYFFVGLVPVETPNAPWFLMLSGAVAICAMILPGISGSFVLVLLGKYEYILRAVNERDIATVGYVAFGIVVGIIAFTQFLSWLLHHYHDLTVAFLIGLMLGSLRKVWPWKLEDSNVLPRLLDAGGNIDQQLLTGLCLIIFGFVVVVALERIAQKKC